ncbi:MAG: mechanosensitive ion channel family protein [Archaeoglobus sp.]|nr:mechanosensitive ion channel family protein [Archaeoglobus sp.]
MNLGETIPYTTVTLLQVITAIVILVVGWILAKIVLAVFRKSLKKTKLPELVIELLSRLFSILLYVMIILLAVSALGISTGSVVIGLSAVIGLILGFGLQDSLTNLAAGIWIAALRPFDKGEVVKLSGHSGRVEGIGIMVTELLTPDNVLITLPNKIVWGSPVVNYTRMSQRRVDVDVGVAYGTDLGKAIEIAMDVMRNHSLILEDPAPAVVVTGLGDSAINLQLRAWTNTENYWAVKGDLTTGIYEAYRKENIEIPFPQMDVHVKEMPK